MQFFLTLIITNILVGKAITTTNVATQHLEDLTKELEEYRELANNRLQELDKLHQTHRETLKEVEKLTMDVSNHFIHKRKEFNCFFCLFQYRYVNYQNLLLLRRQNTNVYNLNFLYYIMNQCKLKQC